MNPSKAHAQTKPPDRSETRPWDAPIRDLQKSGLAVCLFALLALLAMALCYQMAGQSRAAVESIAQSLHAEDRSQEALLAVIAAQKQRLDRWRAGILGAGLGVLVLGTGLAVYFHRRFYLPLHELIAAMDRLRRGELASRVPETGSAALVWLGRRFNGLAAKLGESLTRIQENESRDRRDHQLWAILPRIGGKADPLEPGWKVDAGLCEALNAHALGLFRFDRSQNCLRLDTAQGEWARYIGLRLAPGQGLAGRVWKTGKPLRIHDYSNWPERVLELEIDSAQAIGIPLTAGGRQLGSFCLVYPESDRESPALGALKSRIYGVARLLSLEADNARLRSRLAAASRPDPEGGQAPKPGDSAVKPRKETPAAPAVSDLPPLRLLLVDDSLLNRRIVEKYLKSLPVTLEEAENGAEGMEKFMSQPVDMVLMDMEMPRTDGLEATRRIRKWESRHHRKPIPIISLSANSLWEHKSLAAGCSAFLPKPLTRENLLNALYRFWPDHPPLAEPDSQAAVHPPAEMAEYVPLFLEAVRQDIGNMRQALQDNELETVRRTGHSLKGTGRAYGFDEVSRLGAGIEQAAGNGQDETARKLVSALEGYLETVEVR